MGEGWGGMEGWGRDGGVSSSSRTQSLTVAETLRFFHNLQQIERVPFSC